MMIRHETVMAAYKTDPSPVTKSRQAAVQINARHERGFEGNAKVDPQSEVSHVTRRAGNTDGGSIAFDDAHAEHRSDAEAFFHGDGSINYEAAIQAGHVARSRAFRRAGAAIWRALKHTVFQASGATQ